MVAGMKRSPGACIGKNLASKRKGVVYVSFEFFFFEKHITGQSSKKVFARSTGNMSAPHQSQVSVYQS